MKLCLMELLNGLLVMMFICVFCTKILVFFFLVMPIYPFVDERDFSCMFPIKKMFQYSIQNVYFFGEHY
jgi:hypothetical protein